MGHDAKPELQPLTAATDASATQEGQAAKNDVLSLPEKHLPLVSLILINYNYARYIGQAIDSIKAQDYPRFEVVVVDNASTDGSQSVIEAKIAGDARFRLLRMDRNLRVFNAALTGLAETTGDFVCFIDADDFLLDRYITLHIQTHLALSPGVGFTSNDVIETSAAGGTLCGSRLVAWNSKAPKGNAQPLLDIRRAPRLPGVTEGDYRALAESVTHYPAYLDGWLWSPGSANCFRRSLLSLVAPPVDAPSSEVMSADGYFMRMAHWISGSATIALPLSAYRIHGSNYIASVPTLSGVGIPSQGQARTYLPIRRREMVRQVLAFAEAIAGLIGPRRYWDVLTKAIRDYQKRNKGKAARIEFRDIVASALPELVAHFGLWPTLSGIRQSVSDRMLRSIIAQAYGKEPPRRTAVMLLWAGAWGWLYRLVLSRRQR